VVNSLWVVEIRFSDRFEWGSMGQEEMYGIPTGRMGFRRPGNIGPYALHQRQWSNDRVRMLRDQLRAAGERWSANCVDVFI
jgi:hypothetical protein